MITEQGVPQPAAQGGLRPSGWQLAVIGAVVALAAGIGLVLGFTVLAPRANPLGGAASYVPDDSVMYFEARLDQSPAQAQAFRAVVQRFPAVKADKPLLETIGALIDKGIDPVVVYRLGFIILVASIAGARISHVLFHCARYSGQGDFVAQLPDAAQRGGDLWQDAGPHARDLRPPHMAV